MVKIRDPLHGTVELTLLEERLLDSAPMQRLRGIRQLATAYLVYPGANHTRFEHSIGTLALADRICREAGVSDSSRPKLRAAALLHDVGHTAFSHEAEAVLCRHIGSHEQVGKRMIEKGELGDILSSEFSRREIAELCGKPLGAIISFGIGADRMDYLLRDSHYTGVAYGVIDSDRLCSSIAMMGGRPVLLERGLEAAESLLVARFMMFRTVYLHKTARIASRMLQQSICLAMESGELSPCFAIGMNDSGMFGFLSKTKAGGELARLVASRRLYKKACSLPASKFQERRESIGKLEEELSDSCGCEVLLDVPHIPKSEGVPLEIGGKIRQLHEASELVLSLEGAEAQRLEVLVICEKKHVAKAARAAKRLLS